MVHHTRSLMLAFVFGLGSCAEDRANSCGDAILDEGEECDLGALNGEAGSCRSDCTLAQCGDGLRAPNEACDDGNTLAGDGCSSVCTLEVCGSGHVDPGEECDDGNLANDDACLDDCRAASCGDGRKQLGVEECDDGDQDDSDECTTECRLAICGDGKIRAGLELCDDGNQVDTDECPSTCVPAECGDGFTWAGIEACDDGNAIQSDACLNDCSVASCGDGVLQIGADEVCDDGNLDDGDACTNACTPATCGDGVVHLDEEECDDGNDLMGDGCTPGCVVEYRLAFVSSSSFAGNLGGLAGADAKCQMLANAANLRGSYRAWLSTIDAAPADRFTHYEKPYRTVTQVEIASTWSSLVGGALQAGIDADELGQPVISNSCADAVWSGTNFYGAATGSDCFAWTSQLALGSVGLAGESSSGWTNNSNCDCAGTLHLYCFEQ